jgi:hypothetical protein
MTVSEIAEIMLILALMPEPELAKDRLSIKALAQIAHWFAF